jgi:predicted RNase H-like HicB family nuclease
MGTRPKKRTRAKETRQAKGYHANFLNRGKWWVAWTEDVPGALSQGRTLDEARENLKDAIRLMLEPVVLDALPQSSTHLVQEVLRL